MEENILQEIRTFNRFFAAKLSVFNRYALGTSYSLVEGRIIGEIGRNKNCTAKKIAHELNIDKSYLSRILTNFEKKKLVKRLTSATDGREKYLILTKKGKELFEEFEFLSNRQATELLNGLSTEQISKVLESMRYIHSSLNNEMR